MAGIVSTARDRVNVSDILHMSLPRPLVVIESGL